MKIAAIEKQDRPREKLLRLGPKALSDYELLALILGSGTKGVGVLELSQQVLSELGGTNGLFGLEEVAPLAQKGIGRGKACAILAMAELGRRVAKKPAQSLTEAYDSLSVSLSHGEEAHVIGLDGHNRVLGQRLVGKGDENHLVLSPAEVLRSALALGAKRFVFVHLHPSGVPYPSSQDLAMTHELSLDAKKVGLSLVDHVILSRAGRYSFKENKMLP